MLIYLPLRGRRSFQVRLDHVDDFIGAGYLLGSRFLFAIKNMASDVPLQKFCHEAVHGSPCGAHYL